MLVLCVWCRLSISIRHAGYCWRMQAQPPTKCHRMQPLSKCQAPPNNYWLGTLCPSHGTRAHHKNREGGKGVVRCKKKHKGKKDVIRTG